MNLFETYKLSKDKKIQILIKADLPKNTTEKEIKQRISNVLNHSKLNLDLIETTRIVKTILKDAEQSELGIALDEGNKHEGLTYRNDKLTFYYNRSDNDYEFTFSNAFGINFKSKKYNSKEKSLKEVFNKEINKQNKLINIKPTIPSHEGQILSEIYKLFFKENPDFSCPETARKAECMMYLLEKFNISLGSDYCFRLFANRTVFSIKLTHLMEELAPLGKNIDTKDIKLSNEVKATILVVSDSVNKYLEDKYDKVNALKDLTTIQYVTDVIVRNNRNVNDIATYLNTSSEKVETPLKLIRKIDKRIKEDE